VWLSSLVFILTHSCRETLALAYSLEAKKLFLFPFGHILNDSLEIMMCKKYGRQTGHTHTHTVSCASTYTHYLHTARLLSLSDDHYIAPFSAAIFALFYASVAGGSLETIRTRVTFSKLSPKDTLISFLFSSLSHQNVLAEYLY